MLTLRHHHEPFSQGADVKTRHRQAKASTANLASNSAFSLSKAGLGKESVERLYKGLFVYSIGFNEMIRSITKKTQNSFLVMSVIWKAYSILLEF